MRRERSLRISHSSHEESDQPGQRSRVVRVVDAHGRNTHASRTPITEPTPRSGRRDAEPRLAQQQHDQRQRRLQREQLRGL